MIIKHFICSETGRIHLYVKLARNSIVRIVVWRHWKLLWTIAPTVLTPTISLTITLAISVIAVMAVMMIMVMPMMPMMPMLMVMVMMTTVYS